jgi:hypothetical protein
MNLQNKKVKKMRKTSEKNEQKVKKHAKSGCVFVAIVIAETTEYSLEGRALLNASN